MQLATNCFCELYDADIELQQFAGVYQEIEKAFCNRLYTLNSDQVRRLVPYASQLQDMQLPMSRFTVLFLAGLENEMAEEFTRKFEEDVEWMRSFFAKWESSVRKGFPETLLHHFGTKVQATGNVRDAVICLECTANFETITYSDDLWVRLRALRLSACLMNAKLPISLFASRSQWTTKLSHHLRFSFASRRNMQRYESELVRIFPNGYLITSKSSARI